MRRNTYPPYKRSGHDLSSRSQSFSSRLQASGRVCVCVCVSHHILCCILKRMMILYTFLWIVLQCGMSVACKYIVYYSSFAYICIGCYKWRWRCFLSIHFSFGRNERLSFIFIPIYHFPYLCIRIARICIIFVFI